MRLASFQAGYHLTRYRHVNIILTDQSVAAFRSFTGEHPACEECTLTSWAGVVRKDQRDARPVLMKSSFTAAPALDHVTRGEQVCSK